VPSSIRKALNELPTTLDETYERALREIPKEKRQHAHRLFQCLVVAIRPLRVEELAGLFAIEFDADAEPNLKEDWRPENAEDAVLSTCSTLIAVIENKGSKIVQFSHFSVKEYLTSDRLRTSEMGIIRPYHIPLDAAHTILARACLTMLLHLDENADRKRLETFPLAFYAAQHWVDHAKYDHVASRIQDGIEQLFHPRKPHLAAWTWMHDVDSNTVQETIDDLEERPTRPEGTALYYAVLCGFSGLADYLIITHGENVNAKCGYRGTLLHVASQKGHLDAARLLLALGSDVNTTNKHKRTPLCSAYDGGHLDVMRLLLMHGAKVDVRYDFAGLLLHDASYRGRADVVHLLLQYKADVNARNSQKEAPLHYASKRGKTRVVLLLLEHGALVNAQSKSHSTPLYRASEYGYLKIVQILLGHGADVHIRGEEGLTPSQVATSNEHVEVARLLSEHGAEKNSGWTLTVWAVIRLRRIQVVLFSFIQFLVFWYW
jgi:ankyrin repeat protein